ncbi:MAG: hypothetical protein ABI702_04040 [Burkholderiales bacterium]
MNLNDLTPAGVSSPAARMPLSQAAVTRFSDTDFSRFSVLANAYRRRGGLASGDEVLRLMRARVTQPISALARWMVSGQAISFSWQSCVLLPMFQFELSTMSLRSGPRQVSLELRGVFDDWDLVQWFVEPNSWLHEAAPIDLVERDLAAVLQAARADRFIARG